MVFRDFGCYVMQCPSFLDQWLIASGCAYMGQCCFVDLFHVLFGGECELIFMPCLLS